MEELKNYTPKSTAKFLTVKETQSNKDFDINNDIKHL